MKSHFAVHGIPCKLLTDNGPQFASREFESFTNEWGFEHITGSPYFPQSNGLVENSVKQAKRLLEKCKKDGSDPLLGLLNLRNVPRDQTLGSPAQRPMSRRTRGVLPVGKKLLAPKALDTKHVSSHLELKCQQQKTYYDQRARPLPPLKAQQVVRLQTNKGHEKPGVIKQPAAQPQSYTVQVEGKEYRRNRRHLLAVPEPVPAQRSVPEFPAPEFPSSPPVTPQDRHQTPEKSPISNAQQFPTGTPVRSQLRTTTPDVPVSGNHDAERPRSRHHQVWKSFKTELKVQRLCHLTI